MLRCRHRNRLIMLRLADHTDAAWCVECGAFKSSERRRWQKPEGRDRERRKAPDRRQLKIEGVT